MGTAFRKAAESLSTAAARPGLLGAGAAAAVIAPAIFSTDERGYFQTSLLTTPLITAGFAAGPSIFRSVSQSGTRLLNRLRSIRGAVAGLEDIQVLQTGLARGTVSIGQYEKAARGYFYSELDRKNFARQVTSLRTQFRRYLKDPASSALLANSIFAESSRVMGAEELAALGGRTVAPEWSWRSMWREVHSRIGNEDFVRGMNFRLQQMGRLHDQGGAFTASQLSNLGARDEWGDLIQSKVTVREWSRSTSLQRLLSTQRPELHKEITSAMASGRLTKDDLVELIHVGPQDSPGSIAAVRVNVAGRGPIDIHVPQADGSILMGSDFSRKGVSRKVLDLELDKVLPADIYAIRRVADDPRGVRDVLNKAQFGGYVDRAEDTFQHFQESENFSYQLDPVSIKARAKQVLLHHPEWGKLAPVEREEAIVSAMQRHNLIKTWSEGSLAKGVLEEADLAGVSLGGVYDPMKQSRFLRGLKPIRASESLNATQFSGFHAPFSRTSFANSLGEGGVIPEFGTYIGGVSPHIKSFVGDLPNKKKFLFDAAVKDRAIQAIMKDAADSGRPMSGKQAEKIWSQMRDYLRQGSNLRNVKKLGYLGEGDHLILGRNLPSAITEKTYYVHQVRLKDIQGMVNSGTEFGADTLLGFVNGAAVSASGNRNVLKGFKIMDDGRVALRVAEASLAGTAKIDAHVKGLAIGTQKSQAEAIRGLLNTYNEAAGTGSYIPERTEMLTVWHYGHNKANLAEQTMNIGIDVMRSLQDSGEGHYTSMYKDALMGLGFSDDLVEDSTVAAKLSYEQRIARLQEAVDIVNEMMDDVGARIRVGEIRGNDFLARYRDSNDRLIDYIHRNSSPANAMMWNTVEQNVPQDASITYDMLGHLHLRGHEGVVKELLANSRIDGDVAQTEAVARYLDAGDFSKPLGLALSVKDAVPGYPGSIHLSNLEDRAGTVFDPSHQAASNNWSLKLSDGSHVPVLGHDAYGGKINRYGASQISTNDRERLLSRIMAADFDGDAVALDKAKADYIQELRQFGFGKEGFLRARRVDPHGLTGFIQTAPSSLGPENPFEVAIGSEMLSQVRDHQIRSALEEGQEVYAALARHPVSHVPLVKVRVDRRLNPNVVGIDEGMRGLMMADDDGDIVNMFFLDNKSDAWKEAQASVGDMNSQQHKDLRIQRALEGLEDDPRLARETAYKSIADAKIGLAGKSVEEIMRARTAGGSVGRFSNILTELMLGLESNSKVTDVPSKAKLQRAFWAIRQAPIAAQKSKAANVTGLDDALRVASRLSKGLETRNEKGFDLFFESMLDIGRSFGKSMPWDSSMADLGLSEEMAVEGKINPLLKYIETNRQLFERYHSGVGENVGLLSRSLTEAARENEEGMKVLRYEGKLLAGLDSGALNYLKPQVGPVDETMAARVAEALGSVNEAISGAASEVGRAAKMSKTGPILAAGLGTAALFGLLTTSLHRGGMTVPGTTKSANIRPEATAGAQDYNPDAPIPGSMAHANRARRIIEAPDSTRTGYVVPVNQGVNLEVRARSKDRAVTIEQSKLLSRMSTDGSSSVTVNLRQRGTPKMTLRTKEKLREASRRV